MFSFLAITALISPGVSSFVLPSHSRTSKRWIPHEPRATHTNLHAAATIEHAWSPQDLTRDNAGFQPIPHDDHIKKYQENPELWPVEFFLVPYRRCPIDTHTKTNGKDAETETQILVRKSANGTSRFGLGTGVPATRWMLSTAQVPLGYQWTEPAVAIESNDFPEFPKTNSEDEHEPEPTRSWTYRKIRLRKDAFHDSHSGRDNGEADTPEFQDPELEEFAKQIRDHLKIELSKTSREKTGKVDQQWEAIRTSLVQTILESDNSVAAIQGSLRMSGLFEKRKGDAAARYVDLSNGPDPVELARSVKIYTMFPQMPDPMPLPSTSPEDLKEEIVCRPSNMAKAGRDPHRDEHGRTYTHISTSNVSNTIHGVYLTLDATDYLPAPAPAGLNDENYGDDKEAVPPALDLFGTKTIEREWKSLQELKVIDSETNKISTEDPKPTFISGFIARQLVNDNVIKIDGKINE